MKKFISVLLLITILTITSVCFAENNVELYTQKLQGSWTAKYYNGRLLEDTLKFENSNVWCITGDETGAVFIVGIISNPVNVSNSYLASYRVTLSADEKTMVLFDSNMSVCGIYTK